MEKRVHDRYLVQEPGLLRINGLRGGVYLITVLDVSKSGLRISCSTPIETGTLVEIKCRESRIFGQVRYARNVGPSEFHLGIEAESVLARAVSGSGELDLTLLFQIKRISRAQ